MTDVLPDQGLLDEKQAESRDCARIAFTIRSAVVQDAGLACGEPTRIPKTRKPSVNTRKLAGQTRKLAPRGTDRRTSAIVSAPRRKSERGHHAGGETA